MATLHPNEIAKMREKAQSIYDANEARRSPQMIAMYGAPTDPMALASADKIFDFMLMVANESRTAGWALDYTKFSFGVTPDEVRRQASEMAARNRRRAGYRALKNKYGENTAKRIISK